MTSGSTISGVSVVTGSTSGVPSAIQLDSSCAIICLRLSRRLGFGLSVYLSLSVEG